MTGNSKRGKWALEFCCADGTPAIMFLDENYNSIGGVFPDEKAGLNPHYEPCAPNEIRFSEIVDFDYKVKDVVAPKGDFVPVRAHFRNLNRILIQNGSASDLIQQAYEKKSLKRLIKSIQNADYEKTNYFMTGEPN